jgi:hypothetical protein
MKPYKIVYPNIPSGNVYYFTTKHGVSYEVRFGRNAKNWLHVVIVFGVQNEEYEGEEYVITNKGDTFRVMTTIAEIVKNYKKHHPEVYIYEFSADVDNTIAKKKKILAKMKLYKRFIRKVFGKEWKIIDQTNKVYIIRNKKE